MKSYLEGCGVPTTMVGDVEIPRLIMGIHLSRGPIWR